MFEYWLRNEFNKIKNLKSSKIMKSNTSSEDEDDPMKPLTNFHLQSAYYFFLIGVGVSILSYLIEIKLFFNCNKT